VTAQDIAENEWGMAMRGYFHTGTDSFTLEAGEGEGAAAAFVPRTRAAVLSSGRAIVLAFRGSEPTNLINLRSAGRCRGFLLQRLSLALPAGVVVFCCSASPSLRDSRREVSGVPPFQLEVAE
jgi:hypothetical protein